MKIAVTATGNDPAGQLDMRFGRCAVFMVYDTATEQFSSIDNTQNLQAAQGAGIQAASTVVNSGCTAVITGHVGPKAFTALDAAGVAVYTVSPSSVLHAVEAYKNGSAQKRTTADVLGHW